MEKIRDLREVYVMTEEDAENPYQAVPGPDDEVGVSDSQSR